MNSASCLFYACVGKEKGSGTFAGMGNLKNVPLPNGTSIAYVIDGNNWRIGKKVANNGVRS